MLLICSACAYGNDSGQFGDGAFRGQWHCQICWASQKAKDDPQRVVMPPLSPVPQTKKSYSRKLPPESFSPSTVEYSREIFQHHMVNQGVAVCQQCWGGSDRETSGQQYRVPRRGYTLNLLVPGGTVYVASKPTSGVGDTLLWCLACFCACERWVVAIAVHCRECAVDCVPQQGQQEHTLYQFRTYFLKIRSKTGLDS